jgi:hypothetical protein
MAWEIRPLLTADAAAFRELRLEALQTYPDCFGSTYETEAAKPEDSPLVRFIVARSRRE